jgi:hypothetical protein
MPRGGIRQGAGRKSSWKSGCKQEQTKLIRVPSILASQLLDLAHWLDSGGTIEKVTKSIQGELQITSNNNFKTVTNSNIYNETDFAKEIGVNRSTLKNRKKKYLDGFISEDDFYNYLREQDPQSRNWRYCRERKRYYY